MYALDTNTLVDFFRGSGRVAERLLATPPNQIVLPAVVLYELEVGVDRAGNVERRREQLRDFVARGWNGCVRSDCLGALLLCDGNSRAERLGNDQSRGKKEQVGCGVCSLVAHTR